MKMRIVVFDGVDEIDFIGPYEIFQRAAKLLTAGDSAQAVDVRLVTLEPQAQVTTAHGLRFLPDGVLENADLIVVPGGGWGERSQRGIYAEVQRGLLPKKVFTLLARGTTMAAVCTGTMALAAAGLLQGRPAVTHSAAINELRSFGAQVIEARVVDDGNIVTCGGVTSSLDLALWLVERIWGAPLATKIAAGMEYVRTPDIYRSGRGSQ